MGLFELVTVLNKLPGLDIELEQALQFVVNDGATSIAEKAREAVDVPFPPASAPGMPPALRTGDLRNGITAIPDTGHLEAEVVAQTEYSAFLEYGTSKMAARPFLAPAAEAASHEIEENAAAFFQDL